MSAYSCGRAVEHRSCARFERCGYLVVRSAGSKARVDLVAIKPDERRPFVQCKSGARGLSRRGRIALVDFAADLGATAVACERGLKFLSLEGAR